MADVLDVPSAAHELGVNASRVRALISAGILDAEKVGGRWFVDPLSIGRRRRQPLSAGRPLVARNAWALLLAASGEELPDGLDPMASWRVRHGLAVYGLSGLRPRLERRASFARFRALPGQLRALYERDDVVLSGSSGAGTHKLGLVAPNTVDAYVPEGRVPDLVREHALEVTSPARANVILREVPGDAWFLEGRRVAPLAAVALDLASYPDPRSSRVGAEVLERLDRQREER
jgi:hypothetical protein